MKTNMKNNRLVIASIAIGIAALIAVTMYTTTVSAQSKSLPVPLTTVDTIKAQNPAATIARGEASSVLQGIALSKISEKSQGQRQDIVDPDKSIRDSNNILVSLHHGKFADKDIVAVTIRNTSPKTITVEVFAISGFMHGDVPGSAVETVYRPVISDPYDVAGATTTTPELIPAGQSVTAYIQDTLNADGYGVLVSYSYDSADETTDYAISIPLTWIQ